MIAVVRVRINPRRVVASVWRLWRARSGRHLGPAVPLRRAQHIARVARRLFRGRSLRIAAHSRS
jgi:hypothetical protein